MKVVDTFMYSGAYEDDLLRLRLNTLDPYVDKFIIMESKFSHSKLLKGLSFNIGNFSEFGDKIIYFTRDNIQSENPHLNEQTARNSLLEHCGFMGDEDLLINGDLDEIPEPEALKDAIKHISDKPITFFGKYFLFCMDLYGRPSYDAFIAKRKWVKEIQPFRQHRTNYQYEQGFQILSDGSYHYSSCFSLDAIVKKFMYFCHNQEIPDYALNTEYIKDCIIKKKNWSVDGKEGEMQLVEMKYPNCPRYLEQNLDRYKQYLYSNYVI